MKNDLIKEQSAATADCPYTSIVLLSLPGIAATTALVIASIFRFLKADIRVVLVGSEKIDLNSATYADKIDEIPYDFQPGYSLKEVLKMVIASDFVSSRFVFWPARTFLVCNVDLNCILINKHRGDLADTVINQQDATTLQFLQRMIPGVTCRNFDTGAPLAMDKMLVADILSVLDKSGEDVNFLTVYGNCCCRFAIRLLWRFDSWVLPIISDGPNEKVFSNFIQGKCMIACRESRVDIPAIIREYVSGVVGTPDTAYSLGFVDDDR